MVTNFTCLAPIYDHKITRQKIVFIWQPHCYFRVCRWSTLNKFHIIQNYTTMSFQKPAASGVLFLLWKFMCLQLWNVLQWGNVHTKFHQNESTGLKLEMGSMPIQLDAHTLACAHRHTQKDCETACTSHFCENVLAL